MTCFFTIVDSSLMRGVSQKKVQNTTERRYYKTSIIAYVVKVMLNEKKASKKVIPTRVFRKGMKQHVHLVSLH